MKSTAALPMIILVLMTVVTSSVSARPWRLEDMLGSAFAAVEDIQISPDGNSALIGLTRADVKGNKFIDGYEWIRFADGVRNALPAGMSHPRWSPDGKRIAWIAPAGAGKLARIVLTDAAGNRANPVTDGKRSVLKFAWAPDGTWLAAVEAAPVPAATGPRLRWMAPSSGFLDSTPPKRELWRIDIANKQETLLVEDAWSYGGAAGDRDPSISPDGGRVLATRQPTPIYEDFDQQEHVIVDVKSGKVSSLLNERFFAYPSSAAPMFSPNGDEVAYVRTWDGRMASREDLYIGDRDVTASLDLDLWSCSSGGFSWQKGGLVINLMDGASLRLFRVDPATGSTAPLTSREESVEAFAVAPNGRIAYAASSPARPVQLYVLDPGNAARMVASFATVPPELTISETRYFEWTAEDGRKLHGQLTVPAAADLKQLPMVVEPHGGPQCADDFSFSPNAQYFTSHGYAYFRPDPRGSDGYGDWSYKAIVDNWGPGPMSDVMSGIDAVLAQGISNGDNLYIQGASYGGYLTSWIVTHTDRFKAAVAAVPVTNLLLDYTLSESSNIPRRFFGEKPALRAELLREQSPLTYSNQMHTPLLLLIGLKDMRAPYPQAIEFYKTLMDWGAPVRLAADPVAGHDLDDPQAVIEATAATGAWLMKHGAPPLTGAMLPPESPAPGR